MPRRAAVLSLSGRYSAVKVRMNLLAIYCAPSPLLSTKIGNNLTDNPLE